MRKFLALCSLLLQTLFILKISAGEPSHKHEHVTALRKKLLENYDKLALPSRNFNDTTDVWMQIYPTSIWIDEDRQIMKFNGFIYFGWKDDRFQWNPDDYGGVKSIHFGDKSIWTPDITVINNAEVSEIDQTSHTFLRVHQSWVAWYPSASIHTECILDLTYWPYDTHTCGIDFASWSHYGDDINLRHVYNSSTNWISYYIKETHYWNIVGSTVHTGKYYYWNDVFNPIVHMTVTLKRNSDVYGYILIIPALVVSTLTLLQFVLPINNPKRLTIGCSSALITTLMLIYIANTIPPLCTKAPIIVKFYGQVLLMEVFVITIVCITLRLASSNSAFAPPAFLKTLLTGPLAIVLRLDQTHLQSGKISDLTEDCEVLDVTAVSTGSRDWLLVATVLDRIAALLFILIFIITLLVNVAPL